MRASRALLSGAYPSPLLSVRIPLSSSCLSSPAGGAGGAAGACVLSAVRFNPLVPVPPAACFCLANASNSKRKSSFSTAGLGLRHWNPRVWEFEQGMRSWHTNIMYGSEPHGVHLAHNWGTQTHLLRPTMPLRPSIIFCAFFPSGLPAVAVIDLGLGSMATSCRPSGADEQGYGV